MNGPSESRRGFHLRNSTAMDGAIVDKIIANFQGKPFDEKNGTEPGLITKQNVPNPEGLQVLSTDSYGPKGQESLWQV